MTNNYVINQYGVNKPNFVCVYNWHNLNLVGLVKVTSKTDFICDEFIVAVFKIKWK